MVDHLPQVLDTPIAGSQRVWFMEPICQAGLRPVPKPRKSLSAVKHSMTEVAKHSLQMAAQEFKKICEPKISKLKGGYSANAALIFNSCLKDIDMCVQDCNLTEHEAVQFVKDYTAQHAHGAVEFYLDTNDQWSYFGLIEHLKTSFESGETFSSLLGDFYARCQKPKETEDQFTDELQILARKVISICPKWKSQVNKGTENSVCSSTMGPTLCSYGPQFVKSGTIWYGIYKVLGRMYVNLWD